MALWLAQRESEIMAAAEAAAKKAVMAERKGVAYGGGALAA